MKIRSMMTFLATALLAFGALSALGTQEASALDAYEDRRGVFGGLSIGGGIGTDNPGGVPDAENPFGLGVHASGILGGGVTKNALVGAELNWWYRSVSEGNFEEWTNQHLNAQVVGNFFIVDGLRLDVGAGFAYGLFDGTIGPREVDESAAGFAASGGIGYEVWFNGNTAGTVGVGYTRHFYEGGNFDVFALDVGVRWY